MAKVTYPVIYAPVIYFVHLQTHCLASAGPNANVTGMRKLYWGNCPIIRCGQYIFKVDENIYNRFKY